MYIQLTSLSLFDILFVLYKQPEKLRKRAFDLVSNAYTSIRAEDLARLMGVKTDVAVSGKWSMLLIMNNCTVVVN